MASINRRFFLKTSTAGLALAAAGRTAPSDTLTLGVIGTGGRAQAHLYSVHQYGGAKISAICDVYETNLRRSAKVIEGRQGTAPKLYTDYRELLEDKSLDGVITATPHHWHALITVAALEAGKHIYIEKPASHVFAEGRRIVEAAKRNKRIVQHGTQMRSSEVTLAAAKVLKSGILGKIVQSKAWGVEPRRGFPQPVGDSDVPAGLDWNTWLGPAPKHTYNRNRHRSWNNYRDYGNGEVGGDGIHDIDMMRWGLGAEEHPVKVSALGSRVHVKGETEFPDNLTVTWLYADGRTAIYENRNFAAYKMHGYDNGNIFYGTEGYMVFSRRGYFQTYLGAKEEKGPGMKGGAGNEAHIANFLDCIKNGRQPRADAETTHLSCGLVHLGEIAFRAGRTISFDPRTEKIKGDKEAGAMLDKDHRAPWKFKGA
jgi:predicted dehydrogenase